MSTYNSLIQNCSSSIELVEENTPEIYRLKSQRQETKASIIINPGLCTRHLHLCEPFIGYQLSKLGYEVFVINTLDLEKYGFKASDPFQRVNLTKAAYEKILPLVAAKRIVSLGHSLGCIDLLRAKPLSVDASIFISPGFKADKKKFTLGKFLSFFSALFQGKSLQIYPHGLLVKPELDVYRTDWLDAGFLWNLQKYAHGLEKTHFYEDKPCFVWLGSAKRSDGVMTMKEPRLWLETMKKRNPELKVIIHETGGHEPGWKEPIDAENLAKEIDFWLAQKLY